MNNLEGLFLVGLFVILIICFTLLVNIYKKINSNKALNNIDDLKLELNTMINDSQLKNSEVIRNGLVDINKSVNSSINDSLNKINTTIKEDSNITLKELNDGLTKVRDITDAKLNEIQGNVNKKLDDSLNKRLDENFKQVGERLESLYKSLGELDQLKLGVSDLNRTLSNVKTRGIFGEAALKNILDDILTSSQYDENVETVKGSNNRVEFAIKIPNKEDSGFIYLPIDSKFPIDIYNKIIDSSNSLDKAGLESAIKEFSTKLTNDAKDISTKYIGPPATTDFAIMFLPTESMYAESLRIDGLVDKCRNQYHIIISGPQNLTAILNSLSVGFKSLTVTKRTKEVMDILDSFRKDFGKYNDLIDKIEKQLNTALNTSADIRKRNQFVTERLSKIDNIEMDKIDGVS